LYGFYDTRTLEANWALFTVALWVLSILEDRELAAHVGEVYKGFIKE